MSKADAGFPDSKKQVAGVDKDFVSSSMAADLATSTDSAGRLLLATAVSSLYKVSHSHGNTLSEAAWQATWDLLATQGKTKFQLLDELQYRCENKSPSKCCNMSIRQTPNTM